MPLIKCPECKNNVSTHANFCPKCGCTMQYINDYYQLTQQAKESKKDFPDEVMLFFERVKTLLDSNNIKFQETGKHGEYIGLRLSTENYSFCYVNYGINGKLRIHFYSQALESSWAEEYDPKKDEDFLSSISDKILGINKQQNKPQRTIESLKNYYRYGISENKICSISITYTAKEGNEIIVVYKVNDNGKKQKCLLSEIDESLFRFMPAAEARLKELNNSTIKQVYLIKNTQSNLYVKGTHTAKGYETMGSYDRMPHPHLYEVADFTMSKNDAIFFFDKNKAEEYRQKFEESSNLVVVLCDKEFAD